MILPKCHFRNKESWKLGNMLHHFVTKTCQEPIDLSSNADKLYFKVIQQNTVYRQDRLL